MNVALASVRLNDTSRSVNITRGMRLLDAAARFTPPPDLVVIPPGCDRWLNEEVRAPATGRDSFLAMFAARCREWGVCVVVGAGARNDEILVLLDADGDERGRQCADDKNACVVSTVFGPIGLMQAAGALPDASTLASGLASGDPRPVLLAVVADAETDGSALDALVALCDRCAGELNVPVLWSRSVRCIVGSTADQVKPAQRTATKEAAGQSHETRRIGLFGAAERLDEVDGPDGRITMIRINPNG